MWSKSSTSKCGEASAKLRTNRRSVFADRSGLTLLEMIAALAILTIGIAGVLHAFSSSMAAARAAESYSTAAIMANQVAAELERQTDISPGPVSGGFEDTDKYTWNATVEGPDSNGFMRTTISVLWDLNGIPKHFDMVICLRSSNQQSQTDFCRNCRRMIMRQDKSGFTLIEVLVAAAMLIIVIGAIYGAFRAGSQSSVMIEEDADLHQTARVLLGRINSELYSLYS